MTVKILLDPVLTSQEPSRCSTYIQFFTLANKLLTERKDVFLYWLLPRWVAEEDRKWLPQHERIRYIEITQHKDRTKEYVTLRDEMDKMIAFNGELWDFDILITVRAGLVPLMKMISTSPRQVTHAWMKEIWIIEEMPLMKFKSSVATLHPDVQDLFTLSGHLAAEVSLVMSYHEKPKMLQAAMQWFAPSVVRALDKKMTEVVPAQLKEFNLKDPSFHFVPGAGKQFCIAYVGRMGATDANFDKIYGAMTNQWIIRGGTKVRLLVLTVSTGGTGLPPEHIELQRAPREEFWRIAREEMHLLIIMHKEAGFLLALAEPLSFGVPAIILRAPWSVGMLGKDYPFYASSELEAYTIMKVFYEDYAGMYERFKKWHSEYFVPVFTKRYQDDLMYTILANHVDRFAATALPRFVETYPGRAGNEIVAEVLKFVGDAQEFVLFDALAALAENGTLRSLQQKLDVDDRDTRGLVWATPWDDFRTVLKGFFGWEDASVKVGHMRRIAP
jgi:hypothetical protein